MSDITISFKKHLTRMFKMGYDFASHRIASHRIASHRRITAPFFRYLKMNTIMTDNRRIQGYQTLYPAVLLSGYVAYASFCE